VNVFAIQLLHQKPKMYVCNLFQPNYELMTAVSFGSSGLDQLLFVLADENKYLFVFVLPFKEIPHRDLYSDVIKNDSNQGKRA
jgi:hypothetical protein